MKKILIILAMLAIAGNTFCMDEEEEEKKTF